jgi:hypothetical protein
VGDISGKLGIIRIYYILINAIIMGGIWASYIFGWGGFWIWDPIEAVIFTMTYIIVSKIHCYDTLIVGTLYTIWFVVYTKTSIINGIHSFNILNWLNMEENLIIWSNIVCIATLCYVWANIKISKHWMIVTFMPVIVITTNNINEHISVGLNTYIPTNLINIILWYIIVYYATRKKRVSDKAWLMNTELIYSYILTIKISTVCIAIHTFYLFITMLNIILNVLMCLIRRRKYTRDHAHFSFLMLLIIMYIILNKEHSIADITANIYSLCNKLLCIQNSCMLREMRNIYEVHDLLLNGKKDYYLFFTSRQFSTDTCIDWIGSGNGVITMHIEDISVRRKSQINASIINKIMHIIIAVAMVFTALRAMYVIVYRNR